MVKYHTPGTIFPELNIQTREVKRHGSKYKCGCLFWTFFLIGCILLCAYQIVLLIVNYLSYEFTVEIVEQDKSILEYPDLVVCAMNGFDFSRMHLEGFDNETIEYLLWPLEHSNNSLAVDSDSWNSSKAKYEDWLKTRPEIKSLEDAYEHFAVDPRKYTDECSTATDKIKCFNKPKPKYFTWIGGISFILTPSRIMDKDLGRNVSQRVPGRFGSWNVLLKRPAEASLSIAGIDGSEDFQFFLTKLNENSTESGYFFNGNLGKILSVAIQYKYIKKLGDPYEKCITVEHGQRIIDSHNILKSHYTYETCHMSCQARNAMRNCNSSCIIPGFITGFQHSNKICDPGPIVECMKRQIRRANCSDCLRACDFLKIYKQITTSDYRDPHGLVVEVFHDTMTVVNMMSVESVTIAGLMGSIGGQMSLWLGFKFATIVQLLWYSSIWVFCCCCMEGKDEDDIIAETFNSGKY